MNFDEFNKMLAQKTAAIKEGQKELLTDLAGNALRFVDDNFRNQSWEGVLWKGVKRGGTILVETGSLKRSFNDEIQPNGVRIYTNVQYAGVQNEGFDGIEKVKAHTRGKYQKIGRGKKTKTGEVKVKAFNRHMKITQRQFAPTANSPSPTLNAQSEKIIKDFYLNILKA